MPSHPQSPTPEGAGKCKYGDPACPCQDGDPCHYEGENPMAPPEQRADTLAIALRKAEGMGAITGFGYIMATVREFLARQEAHPEAVRMPIELPPLESCPQELRHGYPDCDCDLEGGDPSCTKKPAAYEVWLQYGAINQRERQLLAALTELQDVKLQRARFEGVALELQTKLVESEAAHERTKEDREFLWGLIDDIDTAADMAKSDDIAYRRLIDKIQQRRHEVGHSPDGYAMVWERRR